MAYSSEAAKVKDMPHVMKYVAGNILDIGCGSDKITPTAFGVDGRDLPGVNIVTTDMTKLSIETVLDLNIPYPYNTVFSSHFLEHIADQYGAIMDWKDLLVVGGHLILYLPDGLHYDNKENPEHMIDMKYDDFMFWFNRSFCGEGKDFKGNYLPKLFELVESGLDVGEQRYSFYVIARRV